LDAIDLTSSSMFLGEKTIFDVETEHGVHTVTVSRPKKWD